PENEANPPAVDEVCHDLLCLTGREISDVWGRSRIRLSGQIHMLPRRRPKLLCTATGQERRARTPRGRSPGRRSADAPTRVWCPDGATTTTTVFSGRTAAGTGGGPVSVRNGGAQRSRSRYQRGRRDGGVQKSEIPPMRSRAMPTAP